MIVKCDWNLCSSRWTYSFVHHTHVMFEVLYATRTSSERADVGERR